MSLGMGVECICPPLWVCVENFCFINGFSLIPGKAKVFVVELSVQFNDVDRDSRWVLSPRVFSKIFCH